MTSQMRISPLIRRVFALALAAALVAGTIDCVLATSAWPGRPDITDFHAFRLAGGLALAGRFDAAYHATTMLGLETALGGGRQVFMPWSYPPPFGIVAAGLAALPLGLAYLLFTGGTLGLYLRAVSRLDPVRRWPVMLASTSGIVLNLRCGQNGLLTAAIVAFACARLLDAKPRRAGLVLSLMAIKPHLIPLVPLALLAERRWAVLGIAAGGAFALTGLSVAVFGPKVAIAFAQAVPDVGRLMALGAYPLHRMTSIFAFCVSIGMPPAPAILLHVSVAVVILAATAVVAARHLDPRTRLGLAVMAGFLVSPYVYDYDLPLFGVGLLLAAPALAVEAAPRRQAGILLGFAAAQSMGLLLNPFVARDASSTVSPAGLLLVGTLAAVLWRLRRASGRVMVAEPV